jgi:hypothetical protein
LLGGCLAGVQIARKLECAALMPCRKQALFAASLRQQQNGPRSDVRALIEEVHCVHRAQGTSGRTRAHRSLEEVQSARRRPLGRGDLLSGSSPSAGPIVPGRREVVAIKLDAHVVP